MKSSVPYAVAVILAGAALRAFAADPPPPSNDGATGTGTDASQLATIIVTAQRRTENIQDVPISMQALTSQTMRELNVQTRWNSVLATWRSSGPRCCWRRASARRNNSSPSANFP